MRLGFLLERSALPDYLVPRLPSGPLNTQRKRKYLTSVKIPTFLNSNSYNSVVERKTSSICPSAYLLALVKYSA